MDVARIIVESGTFNGGFGTSQAEGVHGDCSLIIHDGTFNGSINNNEGGTISISGGYFSVDPTAYLLPGYEVETLTASATGDDLVAYNAGAIYKVETLKVAQIGDVKYASLADAIAAVPTDGTATTITMIDNETVAEGVSLTVPATKNIVLDLNGKTITGSSTTVSPNFYFITNKGTLEITDNSTGTSGKITYGCTNPNPGWTNEYVTICNEGGTFTLTNGTIENTSGGLSYAVNNRSVAQGTATFNLNGGTVSAPSGDAAIRVYQSVYNANSPYDNFVNVTGGTILDSGIFVDSYIGTNVDGSNSHLTINISGGEIHGLLDLKLRHPYNINLNITDGTFVDTKLWVRKFTSEWKGSAEPTEPIVTISGGQFQFYKDTNDKYLAFGLAYDCGTTSWTSYTQPYSVSGGIFNVDLNNFSGIKFPVGMKGVANTDVETKDDYPYTVGESDIIEGDIILIDGEDYVFALDKTVTGQITYQRSFDNDHVGVYQSWLVPFDYVITAADVQKFQFYKINMVANSRTEGNAGNVNENSVFVHIKEMGEGEILRANKPYVIKTLDGYTTGEVIDFESATGATLHGKRINACNSTATSVATYDFYATYNPTTAQKTHDFLYINYLGTMSWANTVTIGSYRWIIKMTAKEEDYAPVFGFINDDGATDIRDAEFASDDDIEGFYTLNGVKVETPSKGVYIVKYNDGRTKKVNLK